MPGHLRNGYVFLRNDANTKNLCFLWQCPFSTICFFHFDIKEMSNDPLNLSKNEMEWCSAPSYVSFMTASSLKLYHGRK